jgi:hypothetical protein
VIYRKYIAGFSTMMERHGQSAIYYAHAGAGELHLRPVLNLKTKEGFTNSEILLQKLQFGQKKNGSPQRRTYIER